MDEIENNHMPENQYLGIYDARLTFRKTGQGEKVVSIVIRYSKKGHARKRNLSFPENIKDDELSWRLYHREHISVYHRTDSNKYVDMKHSIVHTGLGQKLEGLVCEAHEGFMRSRRKRHA